MSGRYEIWLCDDRGQRLRVLEPAEFEYVRVVNTIGTFSLAFSGNLAAEWIALDRMVQIWRAAEGARPRLEFLGFIRRWGWSTDQNGLTVLRVGGPDAVDLLRRRIVAYARGTSQASKSDYADDMMKAFVYENAGAGATDADRSMAGAGLTIQADYGAAGSIDVNAHWLNLLDTLREVAASAANDINTRVFFDVVRTNLSTVEFQTWVGQRGVDHSWPDGGPPVIFGLEFGNMEQPSLEYDHSGEVNLVYAVGPFEGPSRPVVELEDTARSGMSAWNRCEAYLDGGDFTNTDDLTDAGYAMLNDGRPRARFKATLLDTPSCRYGREWGFGDRVTATYMGRQFNAVVSSVKITVKGGMEALDTRMDVLL